MVIEYIKIMEHTIKRKLTKFSIYTKTFKNIKNST